MINLSKAKACRLALGVAIGFAGSCPGQTTTPDTQPKMRVSMRPEMPFVATSMTMLKRKLADGTPVQASSTDIVARDGAGRWYSDEHPVSGRPMSKDIPYRPDVRDPKEGRYIHFVPPMQQVLIYSMPQLPAEPKPPAASVQVHGNMTVKVELLPPQTILGFRAWGQRTTVTSVRDGKSSVRLDEVWYSDELGMDLLRRHVDPFSGEEVTAIMEVKPQEPDPALFQIPAGWQQKDIGAP